MAKKSKGILSDCTVTIKLTQITPMIHFKEETGATLRATELKPKFDRYLSQYFKKLGKKPEEPWFLFGKEQWEETHELASYDYKVKIKALGKNDSSKSYYEKRRKNKISIFGAYFAINTDPKPSSFFDEIEISFLCKHRELRETIEMLFPEFLAASTFGFRQNKGYGYYYMDCDKNEQQQNQWIKNYINQYNNQDNERFQLFQLVIDGHPSLNYKEILNIIKDFNQKLKSGMNHNGKYVSSIMLKEYGYEFKHRVVNEKKAMKIKLDEKAFAVRGTKEFSKADREKEVRYIRGLMGFADHYDFKKVKKNGSNGQYDIEFLLKVEGKNVELDKFRFPNPIRFIPGVELKSVFLLIDFGAIDLLQKKADELKIIFSPKNKKEIDDIKPVEAAIPKKSEFNTEKMFDWICCKKFEKKGIKYKIYKVD